MARKNNISNATIKKASMKSNTRRDFLKKSIAGGLSLGAAGLLGCSKHNTIATRPRQGKSVMGLRSDPIPIVRIGVVGLGRGCESVNRLAHIEGTDIVAISDLIPARIETTQQRLKNAGRAEAFSYSEAEDWKKMCERDDIDLIYNVTPWDLHVPIALYAMEHGMVEASFSIEAGIPYCGGSSIIRNIQEICILLMD